MDNRERSIRLGGDFSGRVNNLRATDVVLGLDDSNYLEGSFSSRNLAQSGSEALNLKLDVLESNVLTLRRLIPRMNLPPNFSKLGRLRFNGQFDGFFTDFAAKGDLRTDIGRAVLDMRMNIEGGARQAEYSGTLSLDGFALGRWTDNAQLGEVNFSAAIDDGVSLYPETASANLNATVETLDFRGYRYENARINGRLEQPVFQRKLRDRRRQHRPELPGGARLPRYRTRLRLLSRDQRDGPTGPQPERAAGRALR